MVRLRCNSCNYAYTPKVKNSIPSRCPYCSDTQSLMEERSIFDTRKNEEE